MTTAGALIPSLCGKKQRAGGHTRVKAELTRSDAVNQVLNRSEECEAGRGTNGEKEARPN